MSLTERKCVCLISSWFGFNLASWQISRLRTCSRQPYRQDNCVILLDFILMHVKFLYHLYLYSITKKKKKPTIFIPSLRKNSKNLWPWQFFHHSLFCWWSQIRSLFSKLDQRTEKLYLSNYNGFSWFGKYFEVHVRNAGKMSPVGRVKVNPRFAYSFLVWHAQVLQKKLHRFNDLSLGSVKVIKELFSSFSARLGRMGLTSQFYTTQIKLLIQMHFSCP